MLVHVDATGGFGKTVLALGPEALLAQRAMERMIQGARKARPDAAVTQVAANTLDLGSLAEMTGASLFTSSSVAVITDLALLPAALVDPLVRLAADPGPDVALGLSHPGGVKGRGVADKLKKAGVQVVECQTVKTWELPNFVMSETRRASGRIDQAAAAALVDAVGTDLRAIASAVQQLLDDSDDNVITEPNIRRYFGGRAEVTSFGVADDVMAGKVNDALAKLRWALSTGVAPVLVTSALASSLRGLGKYLDVRDSRMRDADLARAVGVPPWKIKDLARQARDWSPAAVARAIQSVAVADAQVKGAASDPGFALERLVIEVVSLRQRSGRSSF